MSANGCSDVNLISLEDAVLEKSDEDKRFKSIIIAGKKFAFPYERAEYVS